MKKIVPDSIALLVVASILLFVKIPYVNLLISVVLILVYMYKREGIRKGLGFEKKEGLLKTFLISSALAALIVPMGYLVLLPVIETLTGTPLSLGVFEQLRDNVGLLVTSLALGWIVGGLIEEIIFRAFMLGRFTNILPGKSGLILGAVLPSILFGFLHTYQGPSGQMLTGSIGLMLALIYIFGKQNIWLNIFTHGMVNTFSMLLLYHGVISI